MGRTRTQPSLGSHATEQPRAVTEQSRAEQEACAQQEAMPRRIEAVSLAMQRSQPARIAAGQCVIRFTNSISKHSITLVEHHIALHSIYL